MTMQKTPVKPKQQLKIDIILFVLFAIVVFSKLVEIIIPPFVVHFRFLFHALHVGMGIAMVFVVAYHLILHWSWIKVQFKRLIEGQP